MPPRVHSCIQCRAELPVSYATDATGVGDATDVTCPSCGVEYRAEPADEGVRVYPQGSQQSLTELRLDTLRDFAEQNGLNA